MITRQQHARIARLLDEGVSEENIAIRVNTTRHQVRIVKKLLKPKADMAVPVLAVLDNYRDKIYGWLQENNMNGHLIHQRLGTLGCQVSLRSVQRYIQKFSKKEVYVPVHTEPGEEAQVDYGYLGLFEREGKKIKVWVFNMVLSYSRYAFYCLATDQSMKAFIYCHIQAFEFFGGSPRSVKIDNLGAGVLEADFYQAEFTQGYEDFLDHYGVTPLNCRIRRGQDKGKVEAGIKYVKNNFLPGLEHKDYNQLEKDLAQWNRFTCNLRLHGTTRKIPQEVYIKEEKAHLYSLPAKRFSVIEKMERTIDSRGHLFFRKNYYSVPSHYAGEKVMIEIQEKLFHVTYNNLFVTSHVIDPGEGKTITREFHKPFHKQAKTDLHYREEMAKIGLSACSVYELLRASKPFHWKNMVKGILSLSSLYRKQLIDDACLQGMEKGQYDYKSIRQLCITASLKKDIPVILSTPKNTGGYYHDLKSYDSLINKSI